MNTQDLDVTKEAATVVFPASANLRPLQAPVCGRKRGTGTPLHHGYCRGLDSYHCYGMHVPQVYLNIICMDSQVAGNNWPLYPKVDHYWFKVAHNYEPPALQVGTSLGILFATRIRGFSGKRSGRLPSSGAPRPSEVVQHMGPTWGT